MPRASAGRTLANGRWRARALRALLLIGGLLPPLLAAEWLLPAPPAVISGPVAHRIPHRVRGWALEPGAHYEHAIPEGHVEVVYNSDGWRDVEHAGLRAAPPPRIVVLGDSFMEAYSVALDEAFHRRLARRLSTGREVTTINLGTGGYGTLQSLLAYREAGRAFSPDLVLLGFYVHNDVADDSIELQQAFGSRLRIDGRPFVDPSSRDWRVIPPDYEKSVELFEAARHRIAHTSSSIVARSSLVWAVRSAASRLKDLLSGLAAGDTEAGDDLRRRAMARYGAQFCEEPPEYTAAWGITRRILERLDAEVTASGARLVVFDVPALYDVDPRRVDGRLGSALRAGEACHEEAPGHARLQGITTELGIDYIDLLPGFRSAYREEGLPLHHESDRHWNAAGHALAAEIVARSLETRGLLPGSVGEAPR